MSYPDRVKETSTTTGTGALTLAGAVSKFRAFSPAVAENGTFPYAVVHATANEWESGVGKLVSGTVQRVLVTSSSNSGALVNFSSGTKEIFIAASSDLLSRGMVDPADVGFDIILLAGQSNMACRGTYDSLIDLSTDRVMQWGGYNGDARYQTIFSGADPLHQVEGVKTGLVGPGTHAARSYCAATRSNRRVLLVPTAQGGTTIYGGTPQWNAGSPGGSLYENAITQANAAITAALALYPLSRFVGVLWHQGESDADQAVSQANYVTALKAVIAGFRTRITGASGSWFVIGGLIPETIIATPARATINAAHIQVAAETDKTTFVAGPSGFNADNNHYSAPGIRILGNRMGLAIETARTASGTDVTAPTLASAAVANAAPTSVVLTMSEVMDAAYQPAASAFTVSGHTVSSAVVSGSSITLAVTAGFANGETARTVAYTQPGANNARDLAGNLLANFTGQAITNNVLAAATGVTMSGPTSGTISVASTNFTIGVTPGGSNITGTVVVTPSDGGGGGTFTPTTVSLTNASPSATFTYTPNSTPAARTISVTNNGGLTNPSNITYTSSSGATVPGAPTIGTLTGGDTTASIAFTAPGSDGGSAITGYIASVYKVSDNTLVTTGSGASSPIGITSLTNGVAVYAKVAAINAIGTGAQSAASNNVTPAAVAYATYNPADKGSNIGLTNGNLTMAINDGLGGFKSARSTVSKSSGKWYWENTMSGTGNWMLGIGLATAALNNFVGNDTSGRGYYSSGGVSYQNNTSAAYGAGFAPGDVIGVALNMDAGTVTFYKNGVSQGVAFSGLTGAWFAMNTTQGGSPAGPITTNFGATAFTYTPPTGHVGLQ